MKIVILILPLLAFLLPAKLQAQGNPVTVDDFVVTWRFVGFDPEDPADDTRHHSFELILEKDSTQKNALIGWHCSSVRGGRKIDCADKEAGDEPSIYGGKLLNDRLFLRFVSSWEVEGYATILLDRLTNPSLVLIWELGKFRKMRETYNVTGEFYMPQRVTLQKVTNSAD